MEVKKSPKANLENRKLTSYLLGYIFILACVFVAFESTQTEVELTVLANSDQGAIDEEIIPYTIQQPPPPPPPPPPQAQDIINIVQDTEEIEEVEIEDTEVEEETKIDTRVFDPNEEYGDADAVVDEDPIPFATMEHAPEFPGGMIKMLEWAGKNLRFPKAARNRGVKGRVVVEFIIGKDGKVGNARVVRPLDPDCDKEALRLVSIMPKWKPGKQHGKPVKVLFQWPIGFKLRD